jgi:hypothetical protein
MQPPTTSYPHGYNDTSMEAVPVSNPTFYYPSWNGRWKPVTAHAIPGTVPSLIPLEAEYDECRTPKFIGLGLIHSPSTHLDPASTRPRPTAGQQRSKACMPQDPGSFHHLILYVTMVSGDGWPFSGHVATAASTTLDKTSPLRHPPASLPPLDPIKGKAGDSTKGGQTRRNKSSPHRRRSTSQAISFVISLSLRPGIGSLSHSL